jgi:nicotinate-nucleotide adenylyltransferase
MERIGLFGGTFDPPHLGHLTLAEWARERLALERVVFIPAGRPPHKRGGRISSAAARLAMIRLAVRGNAKFRVSTVELEPEGPSFTVDTLRWFAAHAPRSRLYLLVGADSLADFWSWHEPDQILGLATLVVAGRPGVGRRARPRGRRVVWLGNPGIDVSSSLVRRRARAGRSLRYLVPDPVAGFIERQGLYRRRR